ncbi:hypothetical protein GE09DRAFT_1076125 [Coniochaeta sp. 2T2.1]|nr:hypothetical protein GE09DRAFT_1076125 [Coniochaeta sp. 2T2.1]
MDIMSSPDPLNASLQMDSAPMSSRRVTRSQSIASSRLSSVNPSPRKQTFALDVGDERSPQKIIVTVEADDRDVHSSRARRKLFESPTPKRVIRRREKATTTVVPLKGLTDDEDDAPPNPVAPTPKRRGRPPKSAAGTPAATTKKRATPIRKTPGRPRKTKGAQAEDLTSDVSVPDPDATPKPTRTRTGTKRKNGTPAKEAGETPKPKRRGRPRRTSITTSEAEVVAGHSKTANANVDDNASVVTTEDHTSVAGSFTSAPPSSHGGDDDDIWMNTLSDPPTQFSRRESSAAHEGLDNAPEQDVARLPSLDSQTETDDERQASMEYDAAAGGHCEAEPVASDARGSSVDKDTIMIQEEFTMISINSLPSMQGRLSLAASQEEIRDETSLIINNTLESLRQSRNEPRRKTPFEDEVSFVGLSPEKPSSPLPMNNSMFSQPASTPVITSSPRKARAQDLARQLAMKSLQRQQEPESPQRRPAEAATETEPEVEVAEEQSVYDDSFSEIPEAVLDAATPKPMRRAFIESSHYDSFSEVPEEILDAATPRIARQSTVQEQEDEERSIQRSVERSARTNPSPNPLSESTRLLTPDETPSPVLSEINEDKAPESLVRGQNEWEIQSSPPVLKVSQQEQSSAVRLSRRGSSETPALQVPPAARSPPRMEAVKATTQTLVPPESVGRPTLSPIVRAGRALQMVTTDPPSPPARSPSLGSPFRMSVTKSPAPSMSAAQPASTPQQVSQQSTAQQSTPAAQPTPAAVPVQAAPAPEEQRNSPWSSAFAPFKQIKNLVVQGAQRFSPRAAPSPAPVEEDPFIAPVTGNTTHERQDTLSLHNSMFSLGGGSVDRTSRTSSVQAEVAYEDEMSWQAEDETPAPRMDEHPYSPSSTLRGRNGSEVDMSDADMESLVEESFMEQDEEEEQEEENDLDDDIWAVEAQQPTPGRPQAKVVESEPVLNPPRRSKLPSPWRQNSKRLVYNDELHRTATETIDKDVELSMLSQFSRKEPEVVAQPVQPPKKVDLSAFFSSPALLPEVLPPGISYPKPAQRASAREPATRPLLSSGLRNQPQRAAQVETENQPRGTPSVARSLFSFGRRSGEPQSSLTGAPSLPSVPQKELQIGSQRRVDLFSPVRPAARNEQESVQHQSSPTTPPRQLFAHVPQKRNFTPRTGQTGNSLFAPSPVIREHASADPDDDLSDQEDELDETPTSLRHPSSPSQDSSFIAPVLKPLPSRQQSPTKSSIRSPLKPKTPGRVVEFTSSTLSPLAQAQARAGQRASSAAGSSPAKTDTSEVNKENQPITAMDPDNPALPKSNAAFSLPNSVPRLPPPTTTSLAHSITVPRLSATTWSRAHWERLDTLLQQRRRQGALAFQLAQPVAKTHSTRPKLLGKHVVAQGETMTLEQWHLDVVEAFAAEIGGGSVWDERTLAKRVFALLVGEERRRNGKVDRSKRVVA